MTESAQSENRQNRALRLSGSQDTVVDSATCTRERRSRGEVHSIRK